MAVEPSDPELVEPGRADDRSQDRPTQPMPAADEPARSDPVPSDPGGVGDGAESDRSGAALDAAELGVDPMAALGDDDREIVPQAAARRRLMAGAILGAVLLIAIVVLTRGGSGDAPDDRPGEVIRGAGGTQPGSSSVTGESVTTGPGGSGASPGDPAASTAPPGDTGAPRFASIDEAVTAGLLDVQVVDEVKAAAQSNALVVLDRTDALKASTVKGITPGSPESQQRYAEALRPVKDAIAALGIPVISDFEYVAVMYLQFTTLDQVLAVANHPKVTRISPNTAADVTG